MKKLNNLLVIILFIFSCKTNDNDIKMLMRSKNLEDRINGAFKVGKSGNKEFIPYLLENANDPATSTSLNFKGFSVYQEKMLALKQILKINPPSKITRDPDSAIIIFYTKAASKYLKH